MRHGPVPELKGGANRFHASHPRRTKLAKSQTEHEK